MRSRGAPGTVSLERGTPGAALIQDGDTTRGCLNFGALGLRDMERVPLTRSSRYDLERAYRARFVLAGGRRRGGADARQRLCVAGCRTGCRTGCRAGPGLRWTALSLFMRGGSRRGFECRPGRQQAAMQHLRHFVAALADDVVQFLLGNRRRPVCVASGVVHAPAARSAGRGAQAGVSRCPLPGGCGLQVLMPQGQHLQQGQGVLRLS